MMVVVFLPPQKKAGFYRFLAFDDRGVISGKTWTIPPYIYTPAWGKSVQAKKSSVWSIRLEKDSGNAPDSLWGVYLQLFLIAGRKDSTHRFESLYKKLGENTSAPFDEIRSFFA